MSPRRAPDGLARRVKKLAQITTELRQGASFNITRLTVVKRLCAEPTAAARFALYLAERTRACMIEEAVPSHLAPKRWERFKALVSAGVEAMQRYLDKPTPEVLSALRAARARLCRALRPALRHRAHSPVRPRRGGDRGVLARDAPHWAVGVMLHRLVVAALRAFLVILDKTFMLTRKNIAPLYPYDKKTQTIHLPKAIERELRQLIAEGNKVEALRRVTRLTRAGLRVSKDYVDRLGSRDRGRTGRHRGPTR